MTKDLIYTSFEACAREHPSVIAVEEEVGSVSYGSLNGQANGLAHLLLELGLEPGQVVGVALPAGIRQVRSLLAVFKSGGVYLPLDLSVAPARWRQMLEETHPQVVVVGSEEREPAAALLAESGIAVPWLVVLPEWAGSVLEGLALPESSLIGWTEAPPELLARDEQGHYSRVETEWGRYSQQDPEVAMQGTDDNYIFYTSGSTGRGKGIVGSHKSLSHYIHWHIGYWSIGRGVRISQLAPVTFDASLKDILSAVCSGGTLCVPAPATRCNMGLLSRWLREREVTMLQTVPSVFRLLTGALKGGGGLPSLRQVLLSGEKLYGRDVLNWREVNGEGAVLHNLYGLTETTILKSCYRIQEWDWEPGALLPVGEGISNTLLAVVNGDHICEVGELGDIYIKSPYMSNGYLDRSLNGELFVQNPLSPETDIVCRTGDLGRYRPDGNVEVVGRRDE